jgi:glycerol-3-phosphate dehydrogenase
LKRDFSRLKTESFDIIVIGGGIVGTGIARDAALRGLHTLLVEKEDFGYGTTSRSSRLIHGGLRYLRTFQFKLVRQDLREREILLKIAPHLVKRLKFLIPLPKSESYYRLTLPLGLCLYDILALGQGVPHWQRYSRDKALSMEPRLADVPELTGAYLYYDGQAAAMERLGIENIISADEKGACILNHAAAGRLLTEDNNVTGIQVRDTLSGEHYIARGRCVINAGGQWADRVWEQLKVKSNRQLRKTKGIHLVTRKISENALVLFAKSDGRLFFVIPWNDYSLIGTTDTDYTGDPDNVYADSRDVDYLAAETQHYFPHFNRSDIFYTMAGLRPLVAEGHKAASDTSRAHKVLDHEHQAGPRGLITVLGGKITAHRGIAEEAVNLACRKFGVRIPCVTARTPLPGVPEVSPEDIEKTARAFGLAHETVAHLAGLYGIRYGVVLSYVKQDPKLAKPICPGLPDILAQIRYSVKEEEALTLEDFLIRRSQIGLGKTQGLEAVEPVAREMGSLLDWGPLERQKQLESYRVMAAMGQEYKKV